MLDRRQVHHRQLFRSHCDGGSHNRKTSCFIVATIHLCSASVRGCDVACAFRAIPRSPRLLVRSPSLRRTLCPIPKALAALLWPPPANLTTVKQKYAIDKRGS